MNSIKSFTATGLLSSAMVLGLGTASVLGADFKTTFTLDSAIGDPLVDTVVFNWSTDLTSGTVTQNDLTNWSIELLNGASSVYTESVIIGGVVQPIGGVTRTIGGISFDFNLDTSTINNWDNDVNAVQVVAATGVTYNVYLFSSMVLDEFNNGTTQESNSSSFTQLTEEVAATTPEPSTILGLLAVGSLGALTRKGKKG